MRSVLLHSVLIRVALAGFAASTCLSVYGAPARAAGLEFVLTGDDGYGVSECMHPGMECGRVMADAWCEAHGHGHAEQFGLAEDVVGAIKVNASPAAQPATDPNAVIIRCGE